MKEHHSSIKRQRQVRLALTYLLLLFIGSCHYLSAALDNWCQL